MASSLTPLEESWTGDDTTIAEIERQLARLRDATAEEGAQPNLRTSVMTHVAWVPLKWQSAAEETLAGMAERHPSRTLLLVPRPAEPDGLDATVSIRSFPIGDRAICGEVIELVLRGNRAAAPASLALPLLISDLPVFMRWRGENNKPMMPIATGMIPPAPSPWKARKRINWFIDCEIPESIEPRRNRIRLTRNTFLRLNMSDSLP